MGARIVLREWLDSDLDRYVEMNADPAVMEHFPRVLTRDESIAAFEKNQRTVENQGWGFWAVEVDRQFAGFTGLASVGKEFPFGPATEIGWRFRKEYWGKGIALAAAKDAELFAFTTLQLPRLVSFTAAENVRSWRLMEKLGMVRVEDGEFDHPRIPAGHRLQRHVLYEKNWL